MKEIFFETFFSLVRLFLSTKDEFLKEKLVKKTREFFHIFQNSDDVVQSSVSQDAMRSVDDLNEFIEILVHLKVSDLSPVLLAQKNLLRLRVKIMDYVPVDNFKEEKEANYAEKLKNKTLSSKYKNLETEILQICKDKPDGLSLREIISYLQPRCSRRTLQRSLNKMVFSGFLFKKGTKSSVKYYYVA